VGWITTHPTLKKFANIFLSETWRLRTNKMEPETIILFPPFRLDLVNEQLLREQRTVPLHPKTFALLRYPAEHRGRLVSKGELLRALWGDTCVSEEGLRDYLREIRSALSDNATAPGLWKPCAGGGIGSSPRSVPRQQLAVVSYQFSVSGTLPILLNWQLTTGD
jgi:hypothetical protein